MRPLILFLLLSSFLSATVPDSLSTKLAGAKTPLQKIRALTEISEFFKNVQPDSSYAYAQKVLAIASDLNIDSTKAIALMTMGQNKINTGEMEIADSLLRLSLEIWKTSGDHFYLGQVYINLGYMYAMRGDLVNAQKYFVESLKESELSGDKRAIANSHLNVGMVNMSLEKFEKAREHFLVALNTSREVNYKHGMAGAMGNIAITYERQNRLEEAKKTFLEVLALQKEINNRQAEALTCMNLANILSQQKDFKSAAAYYSEAKKIYESMGDRNGLALVYTNLGYSYNERGDLANAVLNLEKSLAIMKELKDLEGIKDSYKGLYEVFEQHKHFEEALRYHKRYMEAKDSLLNSESTRQLNEIETKYKTEKQQQQIALFEKDGVIQKNIRNSLIAGFVLMLALAGVSYRSFLNKRKAHAALTAQKELVDLKNRLIEEKNKEVLDSIHYASRIQRALITSEKYISRHLNRMKRIK